MFDGFASIICGSGVFVRRAMCSARHSHIKKCIEDVHTWITARQQRLDFFLFRT
jgi:hypothetical protein